MKPHLVLISIWAVAFCCFVMVPSRIPEPTPLPKDANTKMVRVYEDWQTVKLYTEVDGKRVEVGSCLCTEPPTCRCNGSFFFPENNK